MGRSSYQHTLSKHGPTALTVVLVLCGLYASSRYSFLLFHNLVELATALVALLVFVIVWNTRHVQDNRYLLFIGIASLSSGILILTHSHAFTGISIFPAPDADRSMQFWIAYRYILSISFLLASLFIKRQLHTGLTIGAYGLFTFLLVHGVVTGWFPHCYKEGAGMTLFKINSEFAIAALLLVALVLLYRARDAFEHSVHLLLSGSITASLLSALAYTQYVSVAGHESLAGHFFELLATYLIYRAVVVTGVVDPSSLLFRSLKQSEERLRLFVNLINQSSDAFYVADPATSAILELNEAACASTGYSRNELLTMKVTDLAERQVNIDHWTEHVASVREKGSLLVEDRMKRRDGSTFPVEVGVTYLVHEKQDYLVAVIRDISERKQAEEDHAQLVSAVEATVEAVVITDSASGSIQYVNPAFELLTGYTREEALGRTLHFLESGKHDADYYVGLREALARNSVWNGTLMNRKKNGNLYFEECTVSPVRNGRGEIINYVYLKRDVTEKLRLESIAESVSTMDNIGYVFAGVRHEIGNPVNSINMILGILRAKLDTLPSETVRDYLAQMTEQIGRVEYILRSLKSFNLYETQDSQNVDIGSFMENFLPLVRDDFEKKGITLETAVAPGVTANADPRALQQVLLNIFTNAADAVDVSRRPKITTTVIRSDGAVRFRVQDNGMGIPPEKMKDIFRPFYTTKPHGTGLGLVIVKKMLARMNGTIGIESRVDVGTVVDIVIPGGTDEGS